MMSKAKYLFTLAILALVTLLVQAASGAILWFVLPRGGGNRGSIESTFIWERHTWMDIHEWAGVAFLVLIVIHIYLHWKWMYRQTKSLFKRG